MRTSSRHSFATAAERERWARWRAGRLRNAGFPPGLAEQLADQEGIDLHELLELVDRGCPPHLAGRILAPLDDECTRS